MCGVYGISLRDTARPDVSKLSALTALLSIQNDTRGGDSWGFVTPNVKGNDHTIMKGLGKLIDSDKVQFLGELAANRRTLMVHTRAGRMGGVSKETAHPFSVGDIVGAHNGVIYNFDDMKKKYHEYKDYKVDSNVLVGHVAYERDFEELRGWGVLEFINTRLAPRSVFIGKLTENGALEIADVADIGVVWSSDKDHLKRALNAAGFTKWRPYQFTHGLLYEVSGGKLFRTQKSIAIEQYKPSNNTSPYGGHGGLRPDEHWCTATGCWEKLKDTEPKLCLKHRSEQKQEPPKQLPTPTGSVHVTNTSWEMREHKPSTWSDLDSYVANSINESHVPNAIKRAIRVIEDLEGASDGPLPFCED